VSDTINDMPNVVDQQQLAQELVEAARADGVELDSTTAASAARTFQGSRRTQSTSTTSSPPCPHRALTPEAGPTTNSPASPHRRCS